MNTLFRQRAILIYLVLRWSIQMHPKMLKRHSSKPGSPSTMNNSNPLKRAKCETKQGVQCVVTGWCSNVGNNYFDGI